jgi:HK97 family phage portal protein
VISDSEPGEPPPPIMRPAAWSGWPAEWNTPNWNGQVQTLADTAWMCLDLNSSIIASMPPYLVDAADSIGVEWMVNPDPDRYTSWEDFAKECWWDYQLGEVFILSTARYATGYPARFHVVEPWLVDVDFDASARRRYLIGGIDVTADMCHVRYRTTTTNPHGEGPLDAGATRLVAAEVLGRYATNLAASGGVPPSVLTHPDTLNATQASDLQAQWVSARMAGLGLPAVLSGGVKWEATAISPADMALLDLAQFNESRIAVLLGVPPFLVGLPSGGDSMTYSNVSSIFDFHWRAGLRPKASAVCAGLSGWLLPRGTTLELNRDEYVRPDPYTRAQTWQILTGIGVLSVDEVRQFERFGLGSPIGAVP